jgi:hypothetical protein
VKKERSPTEEKAMPDGDAEDSRENKSGRRDLSLFPTKANSA